MLKTNHQDWIVHVLMLSKKISRAIGILSNLRHFVHINILIQLQYSLIYPFLTKGFIIWGNKYPTNINSLYVIPMAIYIITFSQFDVNSDSIFFDLKVAYSIWLGNYASVFFNKLPWSFFKMNSSHLYFTSINTILHALASKLSFSYNTIQYNTIHNNSLFKVERDT